MWKRLINKSITTQTAANSQSNRKTVRLTDPYTDMHACTHTHTCIHTHTTTTTTTTTTTKTPPTHLYVTKMVPRSTETARFEALFNLLLPPAPLSMAICASLSVQEAERSRHRLPVVDISLCSRLFWTDRLMISSFRVLERFGVKLRS